MTLALARIAPPAIPRKLVNFTNAVRRNEAMTIEKSQVLFCIVSLTLLGSLWPFVAPDGQVHSFAWPAVFGAGAVCYLAGRWEHPSLNDDKSFLSLGIGLFLHGWLGVIFGAGSVGAGWILGIIACVNLAPRFGYFRCIRID
ncbi:hypothetical protein GO499_13535 [Algicella marina]|uniref:Uncharacterized protein n=1 Tax=Algicella marina TaxID=2683284 RepID=A0A6P1T066_9RHOB|nr:hypothetical protein GO499_13535 [Algicella marina]